MFNVQSLQLILLGKCCLVSLFAILGRLSLTNTEDNFICVFHLDKSLYV